MLKLNVVLSILLALSAGLATAQDYPNKPVRIFTSSAGGNSDLAARQIAQGLSGPLGQPVIVENRAATLTPVLVQQATPDGYSLMLSGSNVWTRALLETSPYTDRDFAPISYIARDANVVIVHPSLPVKSIKELIALAKARPGQINVGTNLFGGVNFLWVEILKSMAGINMVSIPYSGGPQKIAAIVAGEVQVGIVSTLEALPLIKAGRARSLAVTSIDPSAVLPGVPTVASSGIPGYDCVGITGLWAPAKTPAPIIQRLNQEVLRALRMPEMKQWFLNTGSEVVGSTPEQFDAVIKADVARMAKVIKDLNLQAK